MGDDVAGRLQNLAGRLFRIGCSGLSRGSSLAACFSADLSGSLPEISGKEGKSTGTDEQEDQGEEPVRRPALLETAFSFRIYP